MKKIYLIIALLFIGFAAMAQPSDAAVTKKVRERYKTGTIQLNGSSTRKELIKGIWHYYYWRHFTVTAKSPEGLVGKMTGAVVYEKRGSSYTFDNYATGETSVGGMDDPSEAELKKYLYANLQDFLGGAYNDIVGELPKISIPSGTKFNWASPEQLTFNAKVIYSRKISNTQIEKAEHTYETMLFRKGTDGEWNRVLADDIEGKKKVISKKTYSADEVDAMKTLQDIDLENQASAAMASLPKVEVPDFQTDKQLFYFIHEKLMSSDSKTAKAYLYKVLSKNCFESGSVLLTRDEEWVNKICDNISTYKKTHCEYPAVKDEQSGTIYFYNKEKSASTRFYASFEDGKWKLRTVDYYPARSDAVKSMAGITGNCGQKPDLAVKQVKKYEIGDMVDVTISNTIYAAKVVKKDASFDNRYFVKCINNNRSYWVNDDVMTPSAASASSSTVHKMGSVSSAPKTEEVSFKVGDKVKVRTRSGNMNGKIIKTSGSKHLIKLSDPRYQDMWVSPSNLIKR